MSVLIAVPTRGQVRASTVARLQEIRDIGGHSPVVYEVGNMSVAQTRNRIVQRFLRSAHDTLMMVDDDLVPTRRFLENVLPLDDGWGLVSLPHPMQHPADKSRLVLTAFEGDLEDGLEPLDVEPGLNECDFVALGCGVVSRAALEVLGRAPFRMEHDPDRPFVSDDILFCADLRAAGFRVGYWWDGQPCDHHTVTQLAHLVETRVSC